MRLISLLLALAILGYIIKIYLDSPVNGDTANAEYSTRAQQTIEHAKETAEQINQTLQLQQQKMEQVNQE